MANRLPATDARRVSPAFFYTDVVDLSQCVSCFCGEFRPFRPAKFPRSTKPAPHLFLLAAGTGQHRLFPAPCCTSPHSLQNRVPRGECVPVARKLRADRSGAETKSLLPLPQNRRKHCVSAGFLFTCVVWLWCSRWFRQWVFTSVCICPHLLPSPPAPKTHPVSPFSAFRVGVRFLPSLGPQKFGDDFVAWLAAPLPFRARKRPGLPPGFSQLIPLTPFCGVELVIPAFLLQQLLMGAEACDLTVFQHQDAVGVLDAGHPLGDDKLGGTGMCLAKASRIFRSVAVSTALVESSRISTLGLFNSARAMHSRCRWPPETFRPPWSIQVSYFWGSAG